MSDITARQQRILDFISETVRDRGYPPTVREIGEAVGLTSSSSVHAQLANLERKGLLHRDPTKPRAIGLADRIEGVTVPLVGRIAAGTPVLATEHVEDHVVVPMGFAGEADHFALRVSGDSMIGAGIFDGDIVIVRHEAPVKSGEIAVVLIGEEATVKRIFPRRDKVLLLPENDDYEPIEIRPSDPETRVAGKVVGVFRRLG
jgi:repressor LexA